MSARKRHAYEVALRMAQVKELRAQVALADAVKQEGAAQDHVDAVEGMRRTVGHAHQECVANGRPMDVARYELLTRLDAALADQLRSASDALDEATQHRNAKASEGVMAKRHRELVDERLDELRVAMAHAHAARAQEEGVELWLESREEQP